MTADALRETLSSFLLGAGAAVVIEDGAVLFDLRDDKYSVQGEYSKCLLHLWSHERNIVRRVLDCEIKGNMVRLQVQRMGQNRPNRLEICRDRDRRSPATRSAARATYAARLRRALMRHFPEWNLARLSTNMDLEHSFGPAYVRGLIRVGQRALAVIGVNGEETQPTIDGALTCGLLWLDACRTAEQQRTVEGLVVVLPEQTSALTQQRMAHLHPTGAKWSLCEYNEREDCFKSIDTTASGNLATRLVRATDEKAARERFAASLARIRSALPECETEVLSPAAISFRLRGLEFAQARVAHDPRNLHSGQEIVFGIGAEERVLDDRNEGEFVKLVRLAASIRRTDGPREHPLWRMHPERWLESTVVRNVATLSGRLFEAGVQESTIGRVYSQVPAFSAGDRAMIDVLALTHERRLAVIELKADEDIHLPLQGLDYWSRVAWHHERGEFRRYGYFPGIEMATQKPLLFLVAPALHVHPATDTILRYLSPEIEWELLGIDEHWRQEVRVIFRKRAADLKRITVRRSA